MRVVYLFIALALTPVTALAADPRAILGRWQGTSTCVKAPWNAACNDEVVIYDFVATGPDSTRSLVHAFKQVGDKFEPMGDLAFVYSPRTHTWDGDFENSRVHIRWTYWIRADTLLARLVLLPEKKVARHVVALRAPGP